MRQVFYYLINIAFLVYGFARLVGSGLGFGQAARWFDTEVGRQAVDALRPGFAELSENAIVTLPMAGYLGWSLLMGVVLTVGSLLALFKARLGYILMASYFALFALMFVNYQIINVKLVHLTVGLALFAGLLLLSKRRSA
ncbi:hypothetical protein [Parvularcula lutaonensis]|uniref:DoxX family protein n=1 Tax=Parvularcula lutaonensis TaxID=491923 RepID=A0ABV7MD62_9PROT|nr:hypothetical protein [Parvularcula lutaonensis]GGY40783.1 hypothetical protein GCM10007148_06660 [Parvularcula lutaonensis]